MSLKQVQVQLDATKGVMQSNVEAFISNHENIEILQSKTERMAADSSRFHKVTRNLKSSMWWKNYGFTIVIVAVIVIVLAVFISVAAA